MNNQVILVLLFLVLCSLSFWFRADERLRKNLELQYTLWRLVASTNTLIAVTLRSSTCLEITMNYAWQWTNIEKKMTKWTCHNKLVGSVKCHPKWQILNERKKKMGKSFKFRSYHFVFCFNLFLFSWNYEFSIRNS